MNRGIGGSLGIIIKSRNAKRGRRVVMALRKSIRSSTNALCTGEGVKNCLKMFPTDLFG